MINMGGRYRTADGHRVQLMGRIPNSAFPIVGITLENDVWTLRQWSNHGVAKNTISIKNLVEVEPMTIDKAIVFMVQPSNQKINLCKVGYSSYFHGVEGAECLGKELEDDHVKAMKSRYIVEGDWTCTMK